MFPDAFIFTGTQIVVVTAVALAWLFSFPYRVWHKESHDLMLQLSENDVDHPRDRDDHITAGELKKRIGKLPDIVRKYMESALFLHVHHDAIDYDDDRLIPFARSLRIDQEGEFLLKRRWIPFRATQEFSARPTHAGFVWDAVMKTKTFVPNVTIPVHVRDAYVNGVGIMKAQLPGGIPIVNMKDTPELNEGELMRWVAEAPLFPLALLPPTDRERGKDDKEATMTERGATLEFVHRDNSVRVHFRFDPSTHMIASIHAERPRIVDGGRYEMMHWEGRFAEYEIHGGIVVPTRMEVGWQTEENAPLEMYFRGKNFNFIYLMSDGKKQVSRVIQHEHVE